MIREKSPKDFEEITTSRLEFICEQDGPPERLLKTEIMKILQTDTRNTVAYLARTRLEGAVGVVLGLGRTSGPDERIVARIGKAFASIFGGAEHLDILFLTELQEQQISQVCKPFFRPNDDASL